MLVCAGRLPYWLEPMLGVPPGKVVLGLGVGEQCRRRVDTANDGEREICSDGLLNDGVAGVY